MADKDKKDLKAADKNSSDKKPVKKKERRFHPIRYFREVFAELKKVTWPTRDELTKYTIVVATFVIVMTVLVGVFDFGMSSLFKWGIGG